MCSVLCVVRGVCFCVLWVNVVLGVFLGVVCCVCCVVCVVLVVFCCVVLRCAVSHCLVRVV